MITHDHLMEKENWTILRAIARRHCCVWTIERPACFVCGEANGFLKDHLELAAFTFLKPPVGELFAIPEGKVIHPHTDLWMHRDSKYRDEARRWLDQQK